MKTCSKCGVEKPLTEFHKHASSRDGLRAECKACHAEYRRAHHIANRDRALAQMRERYAARQPEYRAAGLRRRFGISVEQYDAMLAEQGGVCKLCGGTEPSGRHLAVDHHHGTGKVRGLLCTLCNRAVERLDADLSWAERAVAYLAVSA